MIIALTRKQIENNHDWILIKDGGLPGEKEPGLIDSMTVKPFTEFYGQEQYPGIFLKAAVYLHGFAVSQLFNDGNKRTGMLCALNFLDLNGYELDSSWEALFEVSMAVAIKKIDIHQLADWMERNCKLSLT